MEKRVRACVYEKKVVPLPAFYVIFEHKEPKDILK